MGMGEVAERAGRVLAGPEVATIVLGAALATGQVLLQTRHADPPASCQGRAAEHDSSQPGETGIIAGEAAMARDVYTARKRGDDRCGDSRGER